MAKNALKFCILIITFFLTFTNATETRKLLPPETVDCANGSVVHITAKGENDTLHRLYSSSGSFVVLTALTSNKANLTVNCSNEVGMAHFDENPIYSYAMLFTKMLPFYDQGDKADVSDVPYSNVTEIPFDQMVWYPVNVTESEDNHTISVEYSLKESEYFMNNTLLLKLTAFDWEKRSEILPHLMHTVNSTQIEVILDHAPVYTDKPRFAIQMLLIVKENDSNFELAHTRSLDDEVTPGVFRFTQITTDFVRENKLGGFVQWKPIVYTTNVSTRTSATVTEENTMEIYNITSPGSLFVNSLANAFFGHELSKTSAKLLNVTFGASGDEFYSNTNYSSWTLSTGYGIPPKDEISTAIIIILVCGLGIPFLLLVGGGVFVFIKRRREKDDLLLSD